MCADYSFELIFIVHWVPQFIGHNKIFLGSVCLVVLTYSPWDNFTLDKKVQVELRNSKIKNRKKNIPHFFFLIAKTFCFGISDAKLLTSVKWRHMKRHQCSNYNTSAYFLPFEPHPTTPYQHKYSTERQAKLKKYSVTIVLTFHFFNKLF